MKKSRKEKFLSWLAVLAWMAVIFMFSSMKGSGNFQYDLLHIIERKIFHVVEYFVLTMLISRAFLQSFPLRRALIFSTVCALTYAFSDEWHQTFVFAREGTLRDVGIDLIGIMIAGAYFFRIKK